jgi:hypothetical protein
MACQARRRGASPTQPAVDRSGRESEGIDSASHPPTVEVVNGGTVADRFGSLTTTVCAAMSPRRCQFPLKATTSMPTVYSKKPSTTRRRLRRTPRQKPQGRRSVPTTVMPGIDRVLLAECHHRINGWQLQRGPARRRALVRSSTAVHEPGRCTVGRGVVHTRVDERGAM